MKKYIKISGKEKEWIERALNVSRSMVDFALFFDAKWKSHTNLTHPGKVF